MTDTQTKKPKPPGMILDDYHARNGGALARAHNDDEHAGQWSEAFAASFEPLSIVQSMTTNNRQGQWWSMLADSPDYRELRRLTSLRPAAARHGCASLAKSYIDWLEQKKDGGSGGDDDGDGDGNPGDGNGNPGNNGTDLDSANEAAKQALEDAQAADGADMLPGGHFQDWASLPPATQARKIEAARFTGLYRLARIAGRLRITADGIADRRRDDERHVELAGIGPGDRPADLLPAELDALDDPDRGPMVAYRLAQGIADCRTYDAPAQVGSGPIIALVDNSGSMGGHRIISANALVLALAHLAKRTGRGIAAGWWGSKQNEFDSSFRVGAAAVARGACQLSVGGGTDPSYPFFRFPTKHWPSMPEQLRRRGDVILITDGEFQLKPEIEKHWQEFAKENSVRLFIIGIEAKIEPNVEALAEKIWHVTQPDQVGANLMLQLVKR